MDPLAPDDGLRQSELTRDTEAGDNVFELKRRDLTEPGLGHPSGPRSSAAARSSPSTRSATSIDAALATLRPSSSQVSGDALRSVRAVRPDPSSRLRFSLCALAIVQLGMAVAWLVGKVPFGKIVGSPTAGHLSRDAALGVVLGSIGLVVAWRPRWSLSLVPIVGAIVAVQAIGLVADGSTQQAGFHFELPHVVAIIVGTLTFAASRRRTSAA